MDLVCYFVCFWPGKCLITRATGEMSDREAERAGLVTTHLCAVFMQHVKVRILHSVAAKCPFFCACKQTIWLITRHFCWGQRNARFTLSMHVCFNLTCNSFSSLLIVSSWALLKKRREEQQEKFIIVSISFYKTVVCDRVFALYRPCVYPGAVLQHASGPTGPWNS